MPKFHRQRANFGHQRGFPLQGAIWMIGIGFLMLWGDWWPGILILIGLSVILKSVFKESQSQTFGEAEPSIEFSAPVEPAPPVVEMPVPQPIPVSVVYRTDLLPANCPRCGGPIRSSEVKWNSSRSAACPYCGSTLPMKKG